VDANGGSGRFLTVREVAERLAVSLENAIHNCFREFEGRCNRDEESCQE